jgi:hypothetical protein
VALTEFTFLFKQFNDFALLTKSCNCLRMLYHNHTAFDDKLGMA